MKITLYDLALRYVGLSEVPGSLDNPAIMAMLKLDVDWPTGDETAWCSAIVNWWAWHLRLPRSKSLTARSWLSVGRPVHTASLKVGWDVVVLWRGTHDDGRTGHVGLFAGWDRSGLDVLLLGGNQSDAVNVSPYPSDRILGCRRLWVKH